MQTNLGASDDFLQVLQSVGGFLKPFMQAGTLFTADSTLANWITQDFCRSISETRQGLSVFRAQAHRLILLFYTFSTENQEHKKPHRFAETLRWDRLVSP